MYIIPVCNSFTLHSLCKIVDIFLSISLNICFAHRKENACRKYLMINLYESMGPGSNSRLLEQHLDSLQIALQGLLENNKKKWQSYMDFFCHISGFAKSQNATGPQGHLTRIIDWPSKFSTGPTIFQYRGCLGCECTDVEDAPAPAC